MNYPIPCLTHNWRLDLQDIDFVQNPYPYFRFLRDCQPVHRMANGVWVITRYSDIQNFLLNKTLADNSLGNEPSLYSLLNERNRDKYACADVANNMIAFKDGNIHKALRKQIMQAFNRPLKTTDLTFPFLESQLEALHQLAPFNAIKDLGSPAAITIILSLLGISTDHITKIQTLTDNLLYIFSQIPSHETRAKVDDSIKELRDLVRYSLSIADVSDSQIIKAFASMVRQKEISEAEAIDNIILLLVDGAQNVDQLIAMMLLWYKKYSDMTKDIIANRTLMPLFVEECLRFETPVQFVGRVVKSDLELHGQQLKQNQSVLLMLASANRDSDIFDNADSFNIHRSNTLQLTFGRGSHTCLGNQLVRQVMCIVFNHILDIMPTYQIANKAILSQPVWQTRIGHRWLEDYLIHI